MGYVIPCPICGYDQTTEDGKPVYYVVLPPLWLGQHAKRRDEALAKGSGAGQIGLALNFAVAIALLDDWRLPEESGLAGNPAGWEIDTVSLPFMSWISDAVLSDFGACFDVKKKYLPLRKNG